MRFNSVPASALALLLLAPSTAAAAPRKRELPMLEIVTVPAVPGIRFTLDGVSFATRGNGIARIRVATRRRHVLTTSVVQQPARGLRARLTRWEDGARLSRRALRFGGRRLRLRAGFVVSALTTFEFVDTQGRRVPPVAVGRLELATHDAVPILIRGRWSRWLPSRVAVTRAGRLRQSRTRYAVERVIASGSNVVNQGQQRFSPGGRIRISVLFFSLRISVHDAFFGFPIGSSAAIEYPDHHQVRRRLRRSEATFALLPRGNYIVRINARGIGKERDIVVSRDSVASLRIVSVYDGLTVAALFVLSSIALLAIGRGRQLRSRFPQLGNHEVET